MAQPLPQALRIPEVSRFINRANQLRAAKPAIAYWCEYRAINQIVSRRLHDGDPEASNYAVSLMERLEATKDEHSQDESIVDNDVAKAYVEQFAQEIFERAERPMRANQVSRQTADTFDAAATFFELLREWGELEPEIAQKVKFAKWNAARILKAIREGKDPNESNPKVEEKNDEIAADLGLDPTDPDLQQITSPQSASVQDVPDTGEPVPGIEPSRPAAPEDYFPPGPHPAAPVSPMSGDSPSIPTAHSVPPEGPPSVNSIPPGPSPTIPTKLPGVNSPTIPTKLPPDFTPPTSLGSPAVPSQPPAPPVVPTFTPQDAPVPAPAPIPASGPVAMPLPVASTAAAGPPAPVAAHYKDVNKAQKHAKFAISALNFEDIPTAVQELRNALASLGAQ